MSGRRELSAAISAGVLVLLAGIAAGCASSAGLPATATGVDGHRLAAIKYASCMRAHGVTVLDPDRNGNIRIDAPDVPKAAVDRADHACQRLRAALGPGLSPAQHAQALMAMTEYARCMRVHHVPMADPFSGANGVGFSIPPGISPGSQLFQKADAECKHVLPHGG
jgi:hypothetical protein